MRNRASELRIPRSITLPLSHRDSMVSEAPFLYFFTKVILSIFLILFTKELKLPKIFWVQRKLKTKAFKIQNLYLHGFFFTWRVPVAGMEILKNGKYSCLKRTSDNHFVGDGLGKVDFPMTVRVTAVTGEQREAVLQSMQSDNNIMSNVQFSGSGAGGTMLGWGVRVG